MTEKSNCAAETLTGAGISNLSHVKLHAYGFQKGNCPATDDTVAQAASIGLSSLPMEDSE